MDVFIPTVGLHVDLHADVDHSSIYNVSLKVR